MKIININQPRWLEEIINKKEYLESQKRDLFYKDGIKVITKIGPPESVISSSRKVITKKIDGMVFELNTLKNEILIK